MDSSACDIQVRAGKSEALFIYRSMAALDVSMGTEFGMPGLNGSKAGVVEQPKHMWLDTVDLTPIQAISHGPIVIGGISSLFLCSIVYDTTCLLE